MEIVSLVVAGIAAFIIWYFVKGAATLIGLGVMGYLVYYMHSNHPLWIEQVSNAVQTWIM